MMMKRRSVQLKLLLVLIITALPAIFCSSGYITPDSLTATAAPIFETPVPTAYFILPTETPTLEPTITSTVNPDLISPTPTIDENIVEPDPPTPTATLGPISADTPPYLYSAQSGDTVPVLANRFGVNQFEIVSSEEIPQNGFLSPGQMMAIPKRLAHTSPEIQLIPDSEIVFSPSASNFDIQIYVNSLGGKLSTYYEYLANTGTNSGAQVVQQVSEDNSINPRILLGLLQYQSNWVFGHPGTLSQTDYPLGYVSYREKGLSKQLKWAINQLSIGYYNWREGKLTHLYFDDGISIRLAPTLNAGTVAIMYYFNQIMDYDHWLAAIDPIHGFPQYFTEMFGDPWGRAAQVEPLLPSNLRQPPLILPFYREQAWSYTSGPHGAWQKVGSMAAIDFAPDSNEPGCVRSEQWVSASASGIIVRLGVGVVVIDLDGDGDETTGWNILYLHLDDTENLTVGQWVEVGDFIGHPSCIGGTSTGTHIHIARKYNGEWLSAGGAIPFDLGGWIVESGNAPYEGYLNRGDETIKSSVSGAYYSQLVRGNDDP